MRTTIEKPYRRAIRKHMVRAVRASGLDEREVAARAGFKEPQLRRYLAGPVPDAGPWRFGADRLVAFCNATGASPSEILLPVVRRRS